jgi:proteasome activator subunit 4
MERCFHALQTLTETHQTVSALETLCLVIFPLLKNSHYPEGQRYLTELMNLTLPGIDTNDMRKTWSTIKFYTSLLICLPLNTGIALEVATPALNPPLTGEDLIDDVLDVDFSRHHNRTRPKLNNQSPPDAIQYFEEWCIQLLDRIFVVLSHQSPPKKDAVINADAISPSIFWGFCDLFFGQLSSELHEQCAKKVFSFVSNEFLINARKNIGHMCSSLSFADPKITLALFVPMCYDRLVEHTDSGDKLRQLTETEIQWYVHILSQVVFRTGPHVLKYRNQLNKIIELTWDSDAKPIVKSSGKLIRNLLRSLTFVYPSDVRSANHVEWHSDEFSKQHWRSWGVFPKLNELQINWHISSQEELDYATDLLNTFVQPPMQRIRQHVEEIVNDKDKLTYHKKRVKNYLVFIRYAIRGGNTLIPEMTKDPIPGMERYPNSLHIDAGLSTRTLQITYYDLSDMLHDLCQALLRHRKDQEPSVLATIAKTLHPIVCMRGGNTRLRYKKRREAHDFAKQHSYRDTVYMFGNAEGDTNHGWTGKYPRYMLVVRTQLEYKLRCVIYNETIPYTRAHERIVHDLIDMSLSSYSVVRRKAQNVLVSVLHKFSNQLIESLVPQWIDILSDRVSNDEQRTGAIYLLEKSASLNAIVGDWALLSRLLLSLCQTSHIEKQSIQNRLGELFEVYFGAYYHLPLNDQHQVEQYTQLVTKLVELGEKNPNWHWKYQTLVCSFLMLLIRADYRFPMNGVLYMFKSLVSDLEKIRQVAIEGMNLILCQYKPIQKRKPITIVTPDETLLTDDTRKWREMIEQAPREASQWQRSQFIEKNYFGWYKCPDQSWTYDYESEPHHAVLDDQAQTLANTLKQMLNEQVVVTNRESSSSESISFTDRLFTLMIIRDDSFNETNAQFFKGMFQLLGISLLDVFKPQLEQLLSKAGSGKQEEVHDMTTCAELTSGLMRGIKHWQFDDQQQIFTYLLPLLDKVLDTSSMSCIGEWCESLEFSVCDKDPRRALWVKQFLMDKFNRIFNTDLGITSSSSDQLRVLKYLYGVLGEMSWRDPSSLEHVLNVLSIHMAHPYEQVREYIALFISLIAKTLWTPNINQLTKNTSFDRFMKQVQSEFERQKALDDSDVDSIEIPASPITPRVESNALKALCKTTMSWVSSVFASNSPHCAINHVTDLLTVIALVQENATVEDEDLQNLAKDNYMVLAGFPYSKAQSSHILTFLHKVLVNHGGGNSDEDQTVHRVFSNWRIRASLLEFVQVFGFRQQFYLNSEQDALFELLINMLRDPQVEVRGLACNTLAGFIKISDREHIEQLANRFKIWIQKTKTTTKKRNITLSQDSQQLQQHTIMRHSGILGLSAIVKAFPYTLPDFLPPLLVLLAQFSNDQVQQIRETVRKTFAEFWKGHGDMWHIQKKKFSEDQLFVLNDLLISPSYYA